MENMARFGHDERRVPKQALTMGVGTVLDAREVLIVICGEAKALALQKCLEEGVNHMWTVSCLQNHQRAVIVCDEDATVELRVKTVRYFKGMQKTMRTLVAGSNTDGHHLAGVRMVSKRGRNIEQGAAAGSPAVPSKRPRDR
jgi:glucosamine-6-phosphate deaminase